MNIVELLNSKNISEYALSKNSGVPYSTISDLCSGKTDIKQCNVETAYKIAKFFGCTVEDLLENSTEETEFTGESITIQEYYKRYLKNRKNVILCGENALDYMRLTNGGNQPQIEVYATTKLPLPFKVHKVKNFNSIDYQIIDGILITTISQSFNDILSKKDTDYQALDEAMANYYYSNNESFDGLNIKKKYLQKFNDEKEFAIKYYNTTF